MALTYVGIFGIVLLVLGLIFTIAGFYFLYEQSRTPTPSATFLPLTTPTPSPSGIKWWTIALIILGILSIILGAVMLYRDMTA